MAENTSEDYATSMATCMYTQPKQCSDQLTGNNPSVTTNSTDPPVFSRNEPILVPDKYSYEENTDVSEVVNDMNIDDAVVQDLDIQAFPGGHIMNMDKFKQMILNDKIPVAATMGIIVGLPYSGKSSVIQELLKHCISLKSTSTQPIEHYLKRKEDERGLTLHELCVLGKEKQFAWSFTTRRYGAMYSLLCNIANKIRYSSATKLTFDLSIDTGTKSLLDQHYHLLMKKCQKQFMAIADEPAKLSLLSDGISFANILDIGVNKGLYDFLPIILAFCRNHTRYVFYNLENDGGSQLSVTPSLSQDRYKERKDDQLVMKWRPRISYLINFGSACCSERCTTVMVATSSTGDLNRAGDTMNDILQHAEYHNVGNIFTRSNWRFISVNDSETNANLKEMAEDLVAANKQHHREMPLKWLFLRSLAVSLEAKKGRPNIIMKRSYIEGIAKELGMDKLEVGEFLEAFTDFGSILYIGGTFPELEDIVIVNIWKFVKYLNKFYYPPDPNQYPHLVKYGFITQSSVNEILGGNGDEFTKDFMLVFTKLAMIARISKGRASINGKLIYVAGPDEPFYYLPLARVGESYKADEEDFAFLDIHSPNFPTNVQACIASNVADFDHVTLVLLEDCNVTRFQFDDEECSVTVTIEMIYEGRNTKLRIVNNSDEILSSKQAVDACTIVLEGICKCLNRKAITIIRDIKFNVAVPCCSPGESHYLYYDKDTISECAKCSQVLPDNHFRHCWRDAAKKCEQLATEDTLRLKPTVQLTFNEICRIANDISKLNPSEEMLRELSDALNIPKDDEKILFALYKETSFHVMSLLMKWVDKNETKATQDFLSDILNKLGGPFKNISLNLDQKAVFY